MLEHFSCLHVSKLYNKNIWFHGPPKDSVSWSVPSNKSLDKTDCFLQLGLLTNKMMKVNQLFTCLRASTTLKWRLPKHLFIEKKLLCIHYPWCKISQLFLPEQIVSNGTMLKLVLGLEKLGLEELPRSGRIGRNGIKQVKCGKIMKSFKT